MNVDLSTIAMWREHYNITDDVPPTAIESTLQICLLELENKIKELAALRSENERMRGFIEMALNELGVPQPGYPAPVANAVEFLREALRSPAPPAASEPVKQDEAQQPPLLENCIPLHVPGKECPKCGVTCPDPKPERLCSSCSSFGYPNRCGYHDSTTKADASCKHWSDKMPLPTPAPRTEQERMCSTCCHHKLIGKPHPCDGCRIDLAYGNTKWQPRPSQQRKEDGV